MSRLCLLKNSRIPKNHFKYEGDAHMKQMYMYQRRKRRRDLVKEYLKEKLRNLREQTNQHPTPSKSSKAYEKVGHY